MFLSMLLCFNAHLALTCSLSIFICISLDQKITRRVAGNGMPQKRWSTWILSTILKQSETTFWKQEKKEKNKQTQLKYSCCSDKSIPREQSEQYENTNCSSLFYFIFFPLQSSLWRQFNKRSMSLSVLGLNESHFCRPSKGIIICKSNY